MRTWHRLPILTLFVALVMGALGGCMRDAPLNPPSPPATTFSTAVAPVQLVFLGRTYDVEMDRTTFLYQLQNTLDVTAGQPQDLSGILGLFTDVTVELPPCAPEPSSYFPTEGALIDTTVVGIYGITWGVGYDENPDNQYSMTFPGDIPAGTVRGLITTGGLTYVQELVGPCDGTFQIAGNVFVDSNGNGVKDLIELGVAEVTVTLAGNDTSQKFKTDADGNYLFIATAGDYTVSIDSVTAESDFNEILFDAWNPTSPTFRSVTIGPDSFGNDFGFEPDVTNVIEAIDDDVYPTNGKSYKWWRSQLKHALHCHGGDHDDHLTYGGDHHPHWYTADELLGFIHQIQAFALPYQYQFTPGNELREAYNILNNHACRNDHDDDDHEDDRIGVSLDTDEEEFHHGRRRGGECDSVKVLQRELLTTEFNHVTGRGLYTNLPLQYSLITWGEEVLYANTPLLNVYVLPGGDMPSILREPVEEGGKLFGKINGATGGGGTGN
jgi:hypothetical protein